jgi:hypothetical protein
MVAVAAFVPGCSLFLDFSDQAGVHDASIDGPYTPDECAYKEPNNTVAEAQTIMPGVDTGPAAICAPAADAMGEDADFYLFTVPAGTTKVTITLTDSPDGGDLDLILSDPAGNLQGLSRGFGLTETLTCPGVSPACPMLMPGDFVFEVLPGKPGNINNYTFNVALQ